MERKVVLATLISIIILFLYHFYLYRLAPRPEESLPEEEELVLSSPEVIPPSTKPIEPVKRYKVDSKDLLIKTDLLELQLLPEGEIGSLKLTKFKEKDGESQVDLIYPEAAVYPSEVLLSGARLLPKDFRSLNEGTKEFLYEMSQPIQAKIKKRIICDEKTYLVKIELEILNHSKDELILEDLGLGWRGESANLLSDREPQDVGHLFSIGKKTEKVSYKGSGGLLEGISVFLGLGEKKEPQMEESTIEGDISWMAQQRRYFLTVIVPQWSGKKRTLFRKTKDSFLEMVLLVPKLSVPPLERETLSFKVYAGPKDHNELKGLYPGAERLAGLNGLSLLTLKTLRLLYRFTHNYGMAIILLTILIKIILYPFTHASLKSMKAMQRLAPEMNTLKKKYANDREQLNREIMALYKRHKINPLSGCLPLLAQLPFLYAIFTTLRVAIDLRGAPFIFWMKDLSEKDPYYILPILMGASMFVQQKMSVQDPQQAKSMAFMPFIFTIMFANFPSGLVLYWLFQNILSIGQQYLMEKPKRSFKLKSLFKK